MVKKYNAFGQCFQFVQLILTSNRSNSYDEKRRENQHHPKANFHYLASISPIEKKVHPTKLCRVCTKNRVRKETCYMCEQFPEEPAMCVDPCFSKYHQAMVGK